MLVLDASVFVKVLTEEPGSRAAMELVVGDVIAAPELIVLEVAGALSKKVRMHGLPVGHATAALVALPAFALDQTPDSLLIDRAMELSIELKHAIQDCMYLALAERCSAPLVTADKKFLANARIYRGSAEIRPFEGDLQ